MSEPPSVSRRATAWWPAVIALEQVMDAVTATAVAVEHDSASRSAAPVAELAGALRAIAAAVRADRQPPDPADLPESGALKPVAEAVRGVQGALAGSRG
ncbi:MAG: hypothetical protein ACLPUO_19615 [Streptosporangiaceae bacterium]